MRYVFQTVHLPDIPRDDIDDFFFFLLRQRAFPPLFQIIFKGTQHIDTGYQQIVALKFIAVGRLQRPYCPREPLVLIKRVLTNNAKLAVKDAAPLFDRDDLTGGNVIAAH